METKQKILEEMIRIAQHGLIVGVLFNDPELDTFRKARAQAFQRAQAKCSDIGMLLSQAGIESARKEDINKPHLIRQIIEKWADYAQIVQDSFIVFLRENQIEGYSSHPQGSKYDLNLHFGSVRWGIKYATQARETFPAYSFSLSEAISADRNEDTIAHSEVIIL